MQTGAKAVKLCETVGNSEGAALAHTLLGWMRLYRGDLEQALVSKEEALREMEGQLNLVTYVRAQALDVWVCTSLGRWEQGIEQGHRGLSAAEEFSDGSLICFAALPLVSLYCTKGEPRRGLEYAEMAAEKAPTPMDKAWAQSYVGWALCRVGEPDKGIKQLAGFLEMARAAGFMASALPAGWQLAEVYWLAGELEMARHVAEQLLEDATRCGSRYFAGAAHHILGETKQRVNLTLAADHFEQSISFLRESKVEPYLSLSYAAYGRLHKQQGDAEKAREYLTKALEIHERLGTLIEPDKVRAELAGLLQ
jgi:tetratricopeptide (TPR) repeat protein